MKTPWKNVLVAAAIVSAAPASAIPVTFDFTGTVQSTYYVDFVTGEQVNDAGPTGAAFSAQFIIDTDLFGPPESSEAEFSDLITYSSLLGSAVSSSFLINGASVNLSPFSTNTATVTFGNSRGVVELEDGTKAISPDQWNVNLVSEELTPIGRTGYRSLSFGFVADFDASDPTGGPGWFDFSPGIDLDSIATLPMLSTYGGPPSLFLTDRRYSCAERCLTTDLTLTAFTVATVTRSATSVPEPGTLSLFAVGLAGAWFMRRRVVRA